MVGDDEVFVEHQFFAQAVAGGAGALRGVEAEQAGLDLGDGEAADRTGELLAEHDAVRGHAGALHRAGVGRLVLAAGNDAVDQVGVGQPFGQLERGFEAFGQARRLLGVHDDAVDHHLDVVLVLLVERRRLVDVVQFTVDADAAETRLLPLGEFLAILALAAAHDGGEQVQPRALGQRHHAVDHLADRLRADRQAGGGGVGDADPRPEEPHVIVDFGDGRDGRSRVAAGGLLLDRDRGAEAFDMVDVGLLHQFEELAGIGAQGLDVAPLALGIDGVEREGGFARARQSGDHRQRIARDVDRHVLEVVLARAADGDVGQAHTGCSTYVRKAGLGWK